jgi:hypothetical protein
MWTLAARFPVASLGLCAAHPDRSPVYRLLAGADARAGRVPLQIEDDVHPVAADHRYELLERGRVIGARVGRVDDADAEPARLVERKADGVDLPLQHRQDERVVARAVEDRVALAAVAAAHARILGPRVIHAEEANDLAVIDERVPGDVKVARSLRDAGVAGPLSVGAGMTSARGVSRGNRRVSRAARRIDGRAVRRIGECAAVARGHVVESAGRAASDRQEETRKGWSASHRLF